MPGEFSAADRRLIIERDEDRCLVCGRPQMGDGQVHHRQLRSQGGRHEVANGILVCLWCHGLIHGNVAAAILSGHIVSSWDHPDEVPLRSWRGTILLGTDGSWCLAGVDQASGQP